MRERSSPGLRPRRPHAARRRRALALESLEKRVVLTQLQYGLFDTAVDAAGNVLPGASADPHWTVSASPGEEPTISAFVFSSTHPSWVANGSTHGWVGRDEFAVQIPGGNYTYRTTFTVDEIGGGGRLTGQVTGDDNIIDVLINGVSTGYSRPGAFVGWIDLDVSGALVSGTNTIDVIVESAGDVWTGFHARDLALDLLPVLTGSGAPLTVRSGGEAAAIDPNIIVSDPDGPNLTTASVSIGANFTPGEDLLLFTDQNGITGSYNATTGILTLTGSATAEQYQAALRSVRYQNTNATTPNLAPRSVSFSIAPGAYNPDNGHFYEFISQPGVTWTEARAAALGRSLFGLRGYLATITSAEENQFAFSKAQAVGWIGGSDADVEGEWRWMDGPEAGQQFWQGLSDGAPVGGMYNAWSANEPNDLNGEDYAHFLNTGLWNDYADTTQVTGYLVEYGGSPGDPVLQLTSQTTVNIVTLTETPTVTGPAAPIAVNTPTSTITGTAEAGSLVQIYDDADGDGVLDPGETVVGSVQLEPGQTEYSIEVPLTPDEPNDFLVTATLSPADESEPAVVPTITSDVTPPALPTVTGPAAPISVDADTSVITGTAEAGSLVQIYDDADGDGILDPGEPVVGTQQLAPGQTTYSITVPLEQDAANDFLVTATDAVGHESEPIESPTITEDSTPPVAPTVTGPAAPTTVNAPTATLTGTAEAGSLVQIYDDVDGDGVLDPGETVVGTQQLAPGQTTYSITVPLEQDAANDFLVTSTDAAGNESGPVAAPTITEDSTPPVTPALSGPAAPTNVNSSTTTISGRAEAGSLVRIYRDSNGDGVIGEGDALVGFVQLAPGQTEYSVEVPLDPNGPNNFLVSATDAAGNVSSVRAVPTITQDSIAPRAAGVRRFGYHMQPTYVVLTFNEPMDPARAQDPANYRIADPRGRAIRIASVQYDPSSNSATIVPASRLNVRWTYRLSVVGTGPRGLADVAGNLLDGQATGQAGSDFEANLDRSILAGPATTTPSSRARSPRPAIHRAALDSLLESGIRVQKIAASRRAHR